MSYPTLEQVEAADREQLCCWWRLLPSPGAWAVGCGAAAFDQALKAEAAVMDRIAERLKEAGGGSWRIHTGNQQAHRLGRSKQMSTQSDYIAEQSRRCREEWFKNHHAALPGDCNMPPVMTVINWQKPDSWNYGCRFIMHRRWLCVVGDIGEATFEWGQDITLDFLAGLDFGYFLSKCRCSPSGAKFEQWNPRLAHENKEGYLAAHRDNTSRADKLAAKLVSDLSKGSCKEDYEFAAREIYDATGEAELASMISTWGMAPSVHAIGMLVGLQMAIAQLKEQKP